MSPWQAMPWPQRAKYSAKLLYAWLLYATGVLQRKLRRSLHGRTLVLMYHRVLRPEQADQCWSHRAIIVEPRTFDRHMAAVRRHFDVVSLDELARRLARGEGGRRPACLVTFDDGWHDTYSEAWPILREHRIPAVVFLPVKFIGTGERFWQERLAAVLFAVWQRSADAEFRRRAAPVLAELDFSALLSARPERVRQAAMDLAQQQKRTDPSAATAAIGRLAALLGGEPDGAMDGFMDWAQVREMAADGITFGAHSVTHRLLTTLSPEEVREEAVGSRDAVRRELGQVTAFSYPNGDWNPAVAAAVGEAGFALAFSTDRGAVAPGDNALALRRVNIHEDVTRSVPLLLARLSGVL